LFDAPPLLERKAIENGLLPPVIKEGWQHLLKVLGKLSGRLAQKLRNSGLDMPIIELACHVPFPFQDPERVDLPAAPQFMG